MTARLSILWLLFTVVAGCATTDSIDKPIVDMAGVNRQQYKIDLRDCSQYAEQVNTGAKAGAGAVGGAVVGGALGAVFGGGNRAAEGAAAGAVVGGARGVGKGVQERSSVIKNCLRNRGYSVLN